MHVLNFKLVFLFSLIAIVASSPGEEYDPWVDFYESERGHGRYSTSQKTKASNGGTANAVQATPPAHKFEGHPHAMPVLSSGTFRIFEGSTPEAMKAIVYSTLNSVASNRDR